MLSQVDAYSASRNPEVLPELDAHLNRHADTVELMLRSGDEPGFDFVMEHAHRRAAQRFPLDAVLNAYRCLNRVLSDHLREAAIEASAPDAELRHVVAASAAIAIEYTSIAASRATREYVAETRRLAEAEGDRRSELLNLLIEGYDEADARAAALLRRSGYLEQRQVYCVAVIRAVNPIEMENAARVQRIEESIKEVLRRSPVRVLVGIRDNLVIAVLSATSRLSGYTRPHTVVSELAMQPLRTLGNAVFVGLSGDVPSTSHIRSALKEAEQALEFAALDNRVVHAASVPFSEVVLRVAREHARPSLPPWYARFIDADRRGKLAATLNAYADNDMNVLKTAKALGVHANTIYARFEKIEALSGLDPLAFRPLNEMLLALQVGAGTSTGR